MTGDATDTAEISDGRFLAGVITMVFGIVHTGAWTAWTALYFLTGGSERLIGNEHGVGPIGLIGVVIGLACLTVANHLLRFQATRRLRQGLTALRSRETSK